VPLTVRAQWPCTASHEKMTCLPRKRVISMYRALTTIKIGTPGVHVRCRATVSVNNSIDQFIIVMSLSRQRKIRTEKPAVVENSAYKADTVVPQGIESSFLHDAEGYDVIGTHANSLSRDLRDLAAQSGEPGQVLQKAQQLANQAKMLAEKVKSGLESSGSRARNMQCLAGQKRRLNDLDEPGPA
jgi:hypothetical protein